MGKKLNLGITVGDFNGIGPELILKTFSNDLVFRYCNPVIYANRYIFKFYSQLLEFNNIEFNVVKQSKDVKENVVNLRKCSNEKIEITPGVPSTQAGKFALDALNLAVEDLKNGLIHNLVTCPIDKKSTTDAGLAFNGHTGFFAETFQSKVQMILLNDSLRVAMVTGHTALRNVSENLTHEAIVEAIKSLSENLISDFGIKKPRIAVLGVNPHSGDNGLMGDDEITAIGPAIMSAQDLGVLAFGPYPSDGLFGSDNIQNFDAVLGMYHDQVLAPFKQVAFEDGVNYTAGLPFIRTSPDHGTAYDIAGKGTASIASFVNAIYLVNKVYRNRLEHFDASLSPLEFRNHRREKFSIGVPDLK